MTAIYEPFGWHTGESEMHRLTKVPEHENPATRGLTQQAANMLQVAPLLALGTLDSGGRPWTTLLGGEPGLSMPIGGPMVGVRVKVDSDYDPVVDALVPKARRDEQMMRHEGDGKMIAGLAINLMTRKRVKIAGRMLAGIVATAESGEENGRTSFSVHEIQMAIKIEESLGNCPKYINKKQIRPAVSHPKLLFDSPKLSTDALKLINKADMFFISSTQADKDMDTNHRGGTPGFIRIISNSSNGAELIYPEYSGNRLYQTLGNLKVTPLAGIAIPNFESGDVLYATGTTTVLVGKEASDILPHTNLAVKIKLFAAQFVQEGLFFRGSSTEFSPYNPNLRLLASEGNATAQRQDSNNTVKLLTCEHITPTISRYTFAMTSPTPYKPGQWVAMDFSEELDVGYSHMRDDDPKSLNDDYIRTFTISSPPKKQAAYQNELELTLRLHGPVTGFLKRQNPRSGLELPLRGIGGDFVIEAHDAAAFIAGGVGITPLLGQLGAPDMDQIALYWIIPFDDIDFVQNVFDKWPSLSKKATIFFTGTSLKSRSSQGGAQLQAMAQSGAIIEYRRPEKSDFTETDIEKWYICAGNPLRAKLLEWLDGKTVVYESFDF